MPVTNLLGTPSTPAVVTGAASGIGRACALALAEAGRPVALWDLNAEGLDASGKECTEQGVSAHCVTVDVTDRGALVAAAASTVEALGHPGALVHAAGIVRVADDDELGSSTWDEVLAVNLRAEADVVRLLLPSLRAASPGSAVVGIASIEAVLGRGLIPSYVVSKHGLVGLTRSLADRLGPEGIRVNAVCPGYVDTPMTAPFFSQAEMRAAVENAIALRRLAQPQDVATVVRFLLSEEARYVTGAAVMVDGGFTATGGQQ